MQEVSRAGGELLRHTTSDAHFYTLHPRFFFSACTRDRHQTENLQHSCNWLLELTSRLIVVEAASSYCSNCSPGTVDAVSLASSGITSCQGGNARKTHWIRSNLNFDIQ